MGGAEGRRRGCGGKPGGNLNIGSSAIHTLPEREPSLPVTQSLYRTPELYRVEKNILRYVEREAASHRQATQGWCLAKQSLFSAQACRIEEYTVECSGK